MVSSWIGIGILPPPCQYLDNHNLLPTPRYLTIGKMWKLAVCCTPLVCFWFVTTYSTPLFLFGWNWVVALKSVLCAIFLLDFQSLSESAFLQAASMRKLVVRPTTKLRQVHRSLLADEPWTSTRTPVTPQNDRGNNTFRRFLDTNNNRVNWHISLIRQKDEHVINPFTPKSDQSNSSPAASPAILHNTVWRIWLFIACSDERWLYYQFSLSHAYICLWEGRENALFELGSERVKQVSQMTTGQRNNPAWHQTRKGRLTVSNFGVVLKAKRATPS